MEGIKKIIKEIDENGNEIEVEVTEYPDIPVIVVENEEEEYPKCGKTKGKSVLDIV